MTYATACYRDLIIMKNKEIAELKNELKEKDKLIDGYENRLRVEKE